MWLSSFGFFAAERDRLLNILQGRIDGLPLAITSFECGARNPITSRYIRLDDNGILIYNLMYFFWSCITHIFCRFHDCPSHPCTNGGSEAWMTLSSQVIEFFPRDYPIPTKISRSTSRFLFDHDRRQYPIDIFSPLYIIGSVLNSNVLRIRFSKSERSFQFRHAKIDVVFRGSFTESYWSLR